VSRSGEVEGSVKGYTRKSGIERQRTIESNDGCERESIRGDPILFSVKPQRVRAKSEAPNDNRDQNDARNSLDFKTLSPSSASSAVLAHPAK